MLTSRMFATADRRTLIIDALARLPSEEPLRLPLRDWAQEASCPAELRRAVELNDALVICELTLDGTHDRAIESAHPTLRTMNWVDGLNIGMRNLIESAAKATEWIYVLDRAPNLEMIALQDIQSSADAYRQPFELVRRRLPDLGLRSQLQVLTVLTDFALHPMADSTAWPFLWADARRRPQPATERFNPAQRFYTLLRYCSERSTELPFTSKKKLFRELDEYAVDNLHWPASIECTQRLGRLVEEAIAHHRSRIKDSGSHAERDSIDFVLRKLGKIGVALRIRELDPTAFIAPINVDLLNVVGLAPGFVGSRLAPVLPNDLPHLLCEWYQAAIVDDLIHQPRVRCPGSGSRAYALEMSAMVCRYNNGGDNCSFRPGPGKHLAFSECPWSGLVSGVLGQNWRSRLVPSGHKSEEEC